MQPFHVHPLPYFADATVLFSAIRNAHGAILYDSGRPTSLRGRYDLMSAWPVQILQPYDDESVGAFAERLRGALKGLEGGQADDTLPFTGGLMGYLSYDFGRSVMGFPPSKNAHIPTARIGLYTWALVSDHEARQSRLIFHPAMNHQKRQSIISLFRSGTTKKKDEPFVLAANFAPTIAYPTYKHAISSIQDYIKAGDCYQVNFTQRFSTGYTGSPWSAYQTLRNHCATPFGGYINLGQHDAILSFSPERFIQCNKGQVLTQPIKGTMPRGRTRDEDQHYADKLAASEKDRSENVMIVDLLRNDIGRNCKFGSVSVPKLFSIESYPNVHHLVSTIRGELADGRDPINLLLEAFPGGSITGAPKKRAMQIIDELEATERSIYCGSMFYLDTAGHMDSSITIRTLLASNGTISCWGGGGIVAESTAQSEFQESITKIRNLLKCLESYFLPQRPSSPRQPRTP
ncbi:aminodeoxychorismate synthase component I [Pseudomonas sichuanensis]|uniref:aminodeoxychorismate synthase component I n=1 Tax=Pseudomonas sichuanensis TaxID=2213015 RepID=UPI002AB88648|nr:aminodeoxychorismate synthase component I [Pseudomonas sichuanensis]MDZ4021804.1 Aminodeoxychorismate synthase component 1 [Pseudomonas sichuanensis]